MGHRQRLGIYKAFEDYKIQTIGFGAAYQSG